MSTQFPLSWQAPARVKHERNTTWYHVAGIVSATLISYGVLSKNFLFSFIVATIVALYLLTEKQEANIHSIGIHRHGIEYDNEFFAWTDVKDFWILKGDGYHELHVEVRNPFKKNIIIQTGEVDPYIIRDTLIEFLPQVMKKEKILDTIIRFCKL